MGWKSRKSACEYRNTAKLVAPVIFFPLQENTLRAWGTNLGRGWLVESGEDAEALAAAGANRVARRSAPLACGGKVLGFRVWGGWRQGEVLGFRVWRWAIGGRIGAWCLALVSATAIVFGEMRKWEREPASKRTRFMYSVCSRKFHTNQSCGNIEEPG